MREVNSLMAREEILWTFQKVAHVLIVLPIDHQFQPMPTFNFRPLALILLKVTCSEISTETSSYTIFCISPLGGGLSATC